VVLLLLAVVVIIVIAAGATAAGRRRWSRIVAAASAGELRGIPVVVIVIVVPARGRVTAARLSATARLEAEGLRRVDLRRRSFIDASVPHLGSVDGLRGRVLRRLFFRRLEGHWANAIDALDDEVCDRERD
jgi:hypothetical protein